MSTTKPTRIEAAIALLDAELDDERGRSPAFWQTYANLTGTPLYVGDYGVCEEPDVEEWEMRPDPVYVPDPDAFAPDLSIALHSPPEGGEEAGQEPVGYTLVTLPAEVLEALMDAAESLLRRLDATQRLYNEEVGPNADMLLPDGVSGMVIGDACAALAAARAAQTGTPR